MSLASSINFTYLIFFLIVFSMYCVIIFKQSSTTQKNSDTYIDVKNKIYPSHFNVQVCT